MKNLFLFNVCLLTSFALPVLADVSLSPGATVYISSPQNVTCGGSSAPQGETVQICDCLRPDGDYRKFKVAEAVTRQRSGTAAAAVCSAISRGLSVGECRTVTLEANQNIYCGCGYLEGINNNRWHGIGQAFGTNGLDLLKQCRTISPYAFTNICTVK